jgi:hypothetical protein
VGFRKTGPNGIAPDEFQGLHAFETDVLFTQSATQLNSNELTNIKPATGHS